VDSGPGDEAAEDTAIELAGRISRAWGDAAPADSTDNKPSIFAPSSADVAVHRVQGGLQDNNHDCGAFAMQHAILALEHLVRTRGGARAPAEGDVGVHDCTRFASPGAQALVEGLGAWLRATVTPASVREYRAALLLRARALMGEDESNKQS
jgi:hypothetical protein